MEAVKKLPMISFELKNSPEPTSFHNLKQVTGIELQIQLEFRLCYSYRDDSFVLFVDLFNSASPSTTTKIPIHTQRNFGNWNSSEALHVVQELTSSV